MADSPDGGFGGSTDTGQDGQTGSNASDSGGNSGGGANTDPTSNVESDAARQGAFGGPPSTGFSPGEGISGADQNGFIGGEPTGQPGGPPSGGSDGVTASFRELLDRVVESRIRTPDAVMSGFLATLTAAIPFAGALSFAVDKAREQGLQESPPSFSEDGGRGSGDDACGGLFGHCFVPPPVRSTAPPVPGVLPFDFLPAGSPYDAPQPWVPGEGVEALAESILADTAPAPVSDQGGGLLWPALAALGLLLAVADG